MRYTLSGLATGEAAVGRLIAALLSGGIERGRITVSPSPLALADGHQQQTLVAVKTTDLVEAERITDVLRQGGGHSVQSAEESSVLDAV